jgi:hypothetical protein
MNDIVENITPVRSDLFVKRHGEIPCRNPARISYMVNMALAVWAVEGNTDYRFGQLLINAARLGGWAGDDIWNCEDEIFAKGFLMMLKSDMEDANEAG